jgi:hypothetical protein
MQNLHGFVCGKENRSWIEATRARRSPTVAREQIAAIKRYSKIKRCKTLQSVA